MAKRKDSRYLPERRSEHWLKIKARMQYVGHTGTGSSEALLKDLFAKQTPHFTEKCPFTPKPKSQCAGQMGRAKVRLRGRIPGVDNRWQNESAEFSRATRR